MGTDAPNVHYHVEVRVTVEGSAGNWEQLPDGRSVYLSQNWALTVAWAYMDYQRDLVGSYLADHRPELTNPYLSSAGPDDENELVISYRNPLMDAVMECRVQRCDGTLTKNDAVGSELDQILAAIFGDAVTVVEVGPDGTATLPRPRGQETVDPELNAILRQLLG